MEQARTMLPMSIDELERTCLPLEQATMLPGAAFTDPRVLAWELESVFQGTSTKLFRSFIFAVP